MIHEFFSKEVCDDYLKDNKILILLLYVNNLLITSNYVHKIDSIKKTTSKEIPYVRLKTNEIPYSCRVCAFKRRNLYDSRKLCYKNLNRIWHE
jgi:hypothetical protein